MKKCPVCEKTFEDSMRFCQSDGTPLVDEVDAAPPLDPYATIVAPLDLPAEIVPEDPFKTVVAAPNETPAPDTSGDLLQIPEADPLKTMFVSEAEIRQEMSTEEPKEESIFDVPAEPVPEPPAFSEPSLSPPSFGDMAPPASPFSVSSDPEPEASEDATLISPVAVPIPSPFSDPAPQSWEPTPAVPEYKEPEPAANPFDQGSFSPAAETFQEPQQMEWAPPPAPDAGWGSQPVGQNTPFQPPAAGTGNLNQTLPIVSLILGIVSICCYISPVTGVAALITGFLGMKNANNDPSNYGGKGLAIAGMITGGIFLLISIVYWILVIVGFAFGNMGRF